MAGPCTGKGRRPPAGPCSMTGAQAMCSRPTRSTAAPFAASPSAEGTYTAAMPGGILALSANGNVQGSGVLWASTPGNSAVSPPVLPALHAFNAENITQELWNSHDERGARRSWNRCGTSCRRWSPMAKSIWRTASNQVAVYGLFPTYTVVPTSLAFGSQTMNVASTPPKVVICGEHRYSGRCRSPASRSRAAVHSPFSQTNNCGSSVATGAACTINCGIRSDPRSDRLRRRSSINAWGSGAGTQTVALSGMGVASTYTVSPKSLVFGKQLTNVASAPMLGDGDEHRHGGTADHEHCALEQRLTALLPGQYRRLIAAGRSGLHHLRGVRSDRARLHHGGAQFNAGNGAGTQSVGLGGTGIVPTVTLAATPASITLGTSVTLTWTSSNATSCPRPPAGSQAMGGLAANGQWHNERDTECSGNDNLHDNLYLRTQVRPGKRTVTAAIPPSVSGALPWRRWLPSLDVISLLSLLPH